MNYKDKYLKYKNKYLQLKSIQSGGFDYDKILNYKPTIKNTVDKSQFKIIDLMDIISIIPEDILLKEVTVEKINNYENKNLKSIDEIRLLNGKLDPNVVVKYIKVKTLMDYKPKNTAIIYKRNKSIPDEKIGRISLKYLYDKIPSDFVMWNIPNDVTIKYIPKSIIDKYITDPKIKNGPIKGIVYGIEEGIEKELIPVDVLNEYVPLDLILEEIEYFPNTAFY